METGPAITLILADDHGIVREGIAAFCKSMPGISIVGQCADGDEAIPMILDLKPDFAIVDLSMPKVGGIEVVRRVREAEGPTKIVLLSPSREDKVIRDAFSAGADGFVLKDGPAQHIFDAIQHIQGGGQYLTPLLRLETRTGAVDESDPMEQLSKREREVYAFLVDGKRPRDIARTLEISPKTVDTYRANIFRKLGVTSMAELIRDAIDRNTRGKKNATAC